MANQHRHKQRVIRGIPDDLVERFDAAARAAGSDRSSLTRVLWEQWLGTPDVEVPPRPADHAPPTEG
ncbi:ribbon-helix-helix domain-containing protein [Streptomyces sp. NPDC101393]|uniref:ribbon-helix-helix domain-containing protein n=1 Tax=Streptomyces sp. NPDC101393 TaxID=3366141 RepID=UPI0037F49FC6